MTDPMPRSLPLAKHHQVYLVLREQLAEGRFSAGVPGEMRLMDQFGVGRVTVRRALARLVGDGLIRRSPGRGTVPNVPVAGRPSPLSSESDPPRAGLTGLLGNIVDMGLNTTVRVLQCELVPASDEIAQQLKLAANTRVHKVVRVRSSAAGPLSHITTFVPKDLARSCGKRALARQPMLLLLQQGGVEIGAATQTISACLAHSGVAQALGVEIGSALLCVRRLVLDVHERPVQCLQGLYRPDRYEYQMRLSPVGSVDAQVWAGTAQPEPFH